MISRLNVHDFRRAFETADRGDTFSYDGYGVLFEFFEEIDEDWELDVIAICVDWAEDSLDNILKEYNLKDLEELQDKTIVLEVPHLYSVTTYIYQAF